MSALLACADAGINLLFLERNGEVRARWLGRCADRQSLTQRLVDLLARGDGPGLYENWLLSMEKLAARSFARRMGVRDWREISVVALRKQLQISLGDEGRQQVNVLQSLIQAELSIWLPEAGLGSDDEAMLTDKLDLANDLSGLLLWDFYPFLLDNESDTSNTSMLAMANLLLLRADRCYLLFRSTLNKLHQFLLAVS